MNFQSIGNSGQSTGSYRCDLLVDAFGVDGRTPRELAKAAGVSHQTVYQAFEGECKKIDPLKRIVVALKSKRPRLKLMHLFDDDLSRERFRRAVLNGDSRSGR